MRLFTSKDCGQDSIQRIADLDSLPKELENLKKCTVSIENDATNNVKYITQKFKEFFKQKVYLFNLLSLYKKYLGDGLVESELKKVFKEKDHVYVLSDNATMLTIDKRSWKITDGSREYVIEDDGVQLNIYQKLKTQLNTYFTR